MSSISSYLTFTILKKPDDEEELETRYNMSANSVTLSSGIDFY